MHVLLGVKMGLDVHVHPQIDGHSFIFILFYFYHY